MPEWTREHILHTFNEQVERIGFSKITVSSLCKAAGISRGTFYHYFNDKYDVMNYNYKHMLDQAFSFPNTVNSLEDVYLRLYRLGSTYWQPLVRMFDSTGINSLSHFIADYSYDLSKSLLTEKRGRELTETEKMKLRVFCGGYSYMYEDWVRGKYDMTPEEAAHTFYLIVPEEFKIYPWEKQEKDLRSP